LPLLVVIRMTPLLARAPYIAAAAEPFRISTDSMSFGLMSLARLAVTVPPVDAVVTDVELSIGVPSTTNSGWLVPWIVV
jgi:hypothetical protein